jgi:hypothetical protein
MRGIANARVRTAPQVADPRHAWKLEAREPRGPGAACSLEKATGWRGNPKGLAALYPLKLRTKGEPRRGWGAADRSRKSSEMDIRTGHRTGKSLGRCRLRLSPDHRRQSSLPQLAGCPSCHPKGVPSQVQPRSSSSQNPFAYPQWANSQPRHCFIALEVCEKAVR